jgi:alpha-glucosidase
MYPHDKYHNEYALLMAMGTTEGLLSALPDRRTFVLSRAGSAGIQRYAANWMGDNFSRWDHLEMSVPMALGLGISGQAFVGADIGGFAEASSMELLIRWYQCAALTPFCRNHNSNGQPDQYPWAFGGAAEKICRTAIELRYRLMPYIYTQFMLASESGAPVQRPLVFQYQDDLSALRIDDQYLFGGDLLVSPVFTPGSTARNVYLPKGAWHDWRTGEVFEGEQWITSAAPLASIPVHVRGGAVIPLWPDVPASTMGHQPKLIELHVFPPAEDGETTSVLHEDDGETFAFREGACVCTTFTVTRRGAALRLTAAVEGKGFPGFARTHFAVRIHGKTRTVVLNGRPFEALHDRIEFANAGEPFELQATLCHSGG